MPNRTRARPPTPPLAALEPSTQTHRHTHKQRKLMHANAHTRTHARRDAGTHARALAHAHAYARAHVHARTHTVIAALPKHTADIVWDILHGPPDKD